MTMIERVARAICNEVNDQSYASLPETVTYLERKTHVDRPILDKCEARYIASVVIETMREPTEWMSDEGAANNFGKPSYAAWQAMIDAALNEPQP